MGKQRAGVGVKISPTQLWPHPSLEQKQQHFTLGKTAKKSTFRTGRWCGKQRHWAPIHGPDGSSCSGSPPLHSEGPVGKSHRFLCDGRCTGSTVLAILHIKSEIMLPHVGLDST